MLHPVKPLSDMVPLVGDRPAPVEREVVDLGVVLAAARRQTRPVVIGLLIGMALAGAFLVTARPSFTAQTQLLLEENKGRPLDDIQQAQLELSTSDTNVLSQVELLRSDRLALGVVDKLSLTAEPEFNTPRVSVTARIGEAVRGGLRRLGLIGPPAEKPPGDPRRAAADQLRRNLSVDRAGRTLALTLSYEGADATLAARIANAYADAYLNDRLEANFDAAQRTSVWLHGRLGELQEQARQADLAVQQYRNQHGLIASSGKLVAEQQLSEINSQLVLAQADTARTHARNEQFRLLLKDGSPDAILNAAVATGATDESVIGKLRIRYLEATTQLGEVVKRWGADHAEAVKLRAEADDVQRQLVAELERIGRSYANEFAVADSREASLRRGLEQLVGTAVADNQTQVELRALQQKADAYRDLYQNFLLKGQQAEQQRSFPVQAARVISAATVPELPSSPKKALVLALGALLGILGGVGVGTTREFRDRSFHRAGEVTAHLGMKCFGLIPAVPRRTLVAASRQADLGLFPSETIAGYLAANPLSAMAETLRRVKISADVALGSISPKIIGVVSVLPKEGKSSVSASLAQLLADLGSRTLLIDADMRGLGLTRSLGQPVQVGLMDVLVDGRPLGEAVIADPRSGLNFLPALRHSRVADASDILASARMSDLLAEAGRYFDYIVIDLPPLGPVADARSMARHIDAALLVVKWGDTARTMVQTTLAGEPDIAAKTLGIVLNQADMKRLKLYSTPGSEEYYFKSYSSYYSHG